MAKGLDKRLLVNVLLMALVFLALLNMLMINQISPEITPSEEPRLTVTLIKADCDRCEDLATMAAKMGKLGEVTAINLTQDRATDLIARYGIKRLPALVVQADTDAVHLPFPVVDDAYLIQSAPPYVDVATGEVRGVVDATIIEADCEDCDAADRVMEDLGTTLTFGDRQTFSSDDPQAAVLIKRYRLTRLPALILSKEAEVYPLITEQWARIGGRADDGSFVMDETLPPFVDLKTNQTKGLVNVILIRDLGCEQCYDPERHVKSLRDLGLRITSVQIKDKRGAKDLIEKMGITSLPTILVGAQAKAYPAFEGVWGPSGDWVDGWYVFRDNPSLPVTYEDLTTGEVKTGGR